jgi:DNA-binding NtrC family response regulator
LYFRLKVVEITMPPLRARTGDVPLLARAFLREFAEENNKPVSEFSPETLALLMNYSWPGNVRELRTAVEHAVVLCRSDKITPRDLPASVRAGVDEGAADPQRMLARPDLTVKEAEKQLIIRALKETKGNRTLAAQKLGMSRRTLHRKLHTYHLEDY